MGRDRRTREYSSSRVIDMEAAREARRKNRRSTKVFRRRAIYSAVFLVLATVIGLSVFNLISLKISEGKAQKELEKLVRERDRLTEILSHVDSNEYVEQQARQELMMIFPGETLYILTKEAENDKAN